MFDELVFWTDRKLLHDSASSSSKCLNTWRMFSIWLRSGERGEILCSFASTSSIAWQAGPLFCEGSLSMTKRHCPGFLFGRQQQSINWNGPLWTARRTDIHFFIKVRLKSRVCHEQLLLVSEAFVHQPELLNLLQLFGVLHLVYAILLPLAMRSCSMDFAYKLKKLRPEKTRCLLSRNWNSKPWKRVGNEQWRIHHDKQHWIGGRGMNW